MGPEENRVFEALDDPKWDWRTVDGVKRDTGLPATEILKVINAHPDKIRVLNSSEHGFIFQLVNRTTPVEEPIIEKAIDYLTLGKSRRIA